MRGDKGETAFDLDLKVHGLLYLSFALSVVGGVLGLSVLRTNYGRSGVGHVEIDIDFGGWQGYVWLAGCFGAFVALRQAVLANVRWRRLGDSGHRPLGVLPFALCGLAAFGSVLIPLSA
jgi:hypothetical protein